MTEKQKGNWCWCTCNSLCRQGSVLGVQLSALCQSQRGLGLSSWDTELAGNDWNNDSGWFHKQGLRGFKGEKGEPGLPGLDGLDAPCPLVWCTFPFLHACLLFGSWCSFLIPSNSCMPWRHPAVPSLPVSILPSSHSCCQNQALPFILIPSCCQQYFVAWGKIELECGFIYNCFSSSFAFTLTPSSKPTYADPALHWLSFLTRSCNACVLH